MQGNICFERMPICIFPPQKLPKNACSGEKLFAITDMHGSSRPMLRLLAQKPKDARLVFLGDAVDHGSDVRGVLDFLDLDADAILVKGNHDIMAWYSCHEDPSVDTERLRDLWVWYNGGRYTIESFLYGGFCKECAMRRETMDFFAQKKTDKTFDSVFSKMKAFWKSGNLFFIHGGLPFRREDECLAMPDKGAVCMAPEANNHWSWYYPPNHEDGWCDNKQRIVGGEPVYLVCGHSIHSFGGYIHKYAMFLDTGYLLKTAALIDGDSVVFIITPNEDIQRSIEETKGLFVDAKGNLEEGVFFV